MQTESVDIAIAVVLVIAALAVVAWIGIAIFRRALRHLVGMNGTEVTYASPPPMESHGEEASIFPCPPFRADNITSYPTLRPRARSFVFHVYCEYCGHMAVGVTNPWLSPFCPICGDELAQRGPGWSHFDEPESAVARDANMARQIGFDQPERQADWDGYADSLDQTGAHYVPQFKMLDVDEVTAESECKPRGATGGVDPRDRGIVHEFDTGALETPKQSSEDPF